MDLLRNTNADTAQFPFGDGSTERASNALRQSSDLTLPDSSQYTKLTKDFNTAQKQLDEQPGRDSQQALEAVLNKAGKLTSQQLDTHIARLEQQQRNSNADPISRLVSQRDSALNELPEPDRSRATAIASLLEKAATEPQSAFIDCAINNWRAELKKLAPAYMEKQEKIDRLSTNDEIELLKSFKDLPFRGRLSLAMAAKDDKASAKHLADLTEHFSDWELNRHFSKMSPEQAKQFDARLQKARIAVFENYWHVWSPEVQGHAQHLDKAMSEIMSRLPSDQQKEAQQLIRDLCEPKATNDKVVSRFLLQHISPQLADKAVEMSNLRAPLRDIEKQDRALDRLQRLANTFGPARL